MTTPEQVARLRITLEGITPLIWRQVEVPLASTLKALHDVLQAAFRWQGHHLHVFEVEQERFGVADPEWEGLRPIRSEKGARLAALIERGVTSFNYAYDFGDDWRHRIEVEAVGLADPALDYPRFLAGARRAPPEDVGGVLGYEDFVRAVTDPKHRKRPAMLDWHGGPFDPDEIGVDEIKAEIAKLARRTHTGQSGLPEERRAAALNDAPAFVGLSAVVGLWILRERFPRVHFLWNSACPGWINVRSSEAME